MCSLEGKHLLRIWEGTDKRFPCLLPLPCFPPEKSFLRRNQSSWGKACSHCRYCPGWRFYSSRPWYTRLFLVPMGNWQGSYYVTWPNLLLLHLSTVNPVSKLSQCVNKSQVRKNNEHACWPPKSFSKQYSHDDGMLNLAPLLTDRRFMDHMWGKIHLLQNSLCCFYCCTSPPDSARPWIIIHCIYSYPHAGWSRLEEAPTSCYQSMALGLYSFKSLLSVPVH